MRLLSPFILFFILTASFEILAASKPISIVVKIRGTATKLLPGALEASMVEEGDKLPEDTSVVTGPKSFLKIKFVDNSELNMGPESKIVISEMSADSEGIISLLKGRIRTEVQKSLKAGEQTKNKFYIRTRTAALGVRGTDFQTIYNPDNRLTSLLTFNGAVAMAKMDESTHQLFEKGKTTVVRDEADPKKAPELKVIQGKAISEKDELIKILASNSTVVVPPGQNAFTSNALKKSSLPVKISPVQLNALYKNTEFNEKNVVNLKSGNTLIGSAAVIPVADQKAPIEGFYNAQTGDLAPKAGGYIDQNTGIYIAPDASAKLDEKNGVYVSERTGDFDADTGQYVAPKGIILDAKKGFILDPKSDVKPELLALREDLNHSIARDVVVGDLDGEVMIAERTLKEKYIRNKLTFSISGMDENLKLNSTENIDAKGAWKMSGLWQSSSTTRLTTLLGASYASMGYGSLLARGHSQDSKSVFSLLMGLKYALTNRIDLISGISLDQAHYANQTSSSPSAYQFKRVVLTKFNLGAGFELMRSNSWSIMGEAMGKFGFRKRFNTLVISEISGLGLKISPQYSIDDRKSISLGLFTEFEKSKLTNNSGVNSQKREIHGLEFKYNLDLI